MPVTYGRSVENGREETWGEVTGFTLAGDTLVFRITLLHPYRHYVETNGVWQKDDDELLCHLDFLNVTQGISGRYANIWLPDKQGGDNGLRRFSAHRTLVVLLQTNQPFDPSPVYP